MTKSKAKSSTIRSGQGDFKLQSKQRLTPRMAKVQSRSCSPVQSPSPTSIPPRSKVAFADFVNFSSDARVFNPLGSDMNFDHQKMCRGKTKVSNSLHRSKQTVSSPLPAQGHSSMPCPNERIPTTPGIIMPQAGCSQIPLTGSTPGHTTRNRKRPHDNSTCSVRSSPSAKTAAVEKQDPYCAGPSSNFREDPMSTEAAAADLPSTQPPDCKRSKADGSKSIDPGKKANASKVPRRQYLTRSKAAVTSCLGLKPNTPAVSLLDCGEFPVQLLLFVSDLVIDSLRLASCGCYSIFAPGVGLLTTL
ncbi:hypothetical protein D5086_033224 [Populus alba]|uniref:Uncharacterized protein n=1 Tax=Populus alba TaxID=43335 RepID=A0ACC4AG79_POPAL